MNLDALIERIADRVAERLKPTPKPKPQPRPAAARVETELERIQRNFAFLREHGGIIAEGRYDPETGQIDWWR
jgi:hypothetical protein